MVSEPQLRVDVRRPRFGTAFGKIRLHSLHFDHHSHGFLVVDGIASNRVSSGQVLFLGVEEWCKRSTLWGADPRHRLRPRSEEHTSELQSLMRISYAVFCLKKKQKRKSDVNQEVKKIS